MARFNSKHLTRQQQERIWDDFCGAALLLNNIHESRRFFRDILNRSERTMLARRLEIALMLELGFTYEEIAQTLHAGKQTIAKVSRWLNFGRNGYREVIRKMRKTERRAWRSIFSNYYKIGKD